MCATTKACVACTAVSAIMLLGAKRVWINAPLIHTLLGLETNSGSETQVALAYTYSGCNVTEVRVIYIRLWVSKVRMVKKVQCFATQLELNPLSDEDRLEYSKIYIKECWSPEIISTRISEFSPCLRSPGTSTGAIDSKD